MFQRKHRSFKVDEEKGDKMRTHCQTIITAGSDNHPHYSHGTPSLCSGVPFGMVLPLPQTTHEQGLGFASPNLLFFSGISSHPPTLVLGWGDYAWTLITPITGEIAFRPLPSPKQLFDERSHFPALPSDFGTLSDSQWQFGSQAATGLSHALFEHQKADSLLSCNKGTRGLDPYRPNLPLPTFWIRPIPRILPTLSISSGNYCAIERHHVIKIFSWPLLAGSDQ